MSAPQVLSQTVAAWPTATAMGQAPARVAKEVVRAKGGSLVTSRRRANSRRTTVFSWSLFSALTLLVANGMLLGWYVFSVNTFAGMGYQGYQMQEQLADFREQQRSLQVQLAERGSAARLQGELATSKEFVPVGTPEFVVAGQSGLSMK